MIEFPTVVFSMLLGLVVFYWTFVILGALEMDLLGGAHGATDALDALDAGHHGVLDAVHEAIHPDGAHEVLEGTLPGVLNALGIRGVPVTVWLSLFVLYSWAITLTAMATIGPSLGARLGGFATGAVVSVLAIAIAAAGAAVSVRPLKPLFFVHQALGRDSLVGKTCTVTTLRVDDGFGQAQVEDGGAGLLVQVRCGEPNDLTRGSQALIFDYDSDDGVFHITRFDEPPDVRALDRRVRTPR